MENINYMSPIYVTRDHIESVRDEKDRMSMSNIHVTRDQILSIRDEKDWP